MLQKRKENLDANTEKPVTNYLPMEIKMEVLKCINKGKLGVNIQRIIGLPESSIRTIRQNADAIR